MANEEKALDMLGQVLEWQDCMESELLSVKATQENVVIPNIKLLAVDHAGIMDALVPKERVEPD